MDNKAAALLFLRRFAERCGLGTYVSTHLISRETAIPESTLFDWDTDTGVLQELSDVGLINKQPTKSGACWCADGGGVYWPET